MDKEKQIKEMAKVLGENRGDCDASDCMRCSHGGMCDYMGIAYTLYEAGYRKQKEGEWLQDFDGDYYCPFCAHYPKEIINFCPNCGAKMKGGE